jgi:hypothetical protein
MRNTIKQTLLAILELLGPPGSGGTKPPHFRNRTCWGLGFLIGTVGFIYSGDWPVKEILPPDHLEGVHREICFLFIVYAFRNMSYTFIISVPNIPILSLIIQMSTEGSTYFKRGLKKYKTQVHIQKEHG